MPHAVSGTSWQYFILLYFPFASFSHLESVSDSAAGASVVCASGRAGPPAHAWLGPSFRAGTEAPASRYLPAFPEAGSRISRLVPRWRFCSPTSGAHRARRLRIQPAAAAPGPRTGPKVGSGAAWPGFGEDAPPPLGWQTSTFRCVPTGQRGRARPPFLTTHPPPPALMASLRKASPPNTTAGGVRASTCGRGWGWGRSLQPLTTIT